MKFHQQELRSIVLQDNRNCVSRRLPEEDEATKGEAVEYVKVCSQFGPGFFYLPGSDTCLQIAGTELPAAEKAFVARWIDQG